MMSDASYAQLLRFHAILEQVDGTCHYDPQILQSLWRFIGKNIPFIFGIEYALNSLEASVRLRCK